MKITNKRIIVKLLPVTVLFITIYSVIGFLTFASLSSAVTNTTLWWAISAAIVIIFSLAVINFYDRQNNQNMILLFLYILWNIYCIIRGVFIIESYWDWKALIGNTMILMLPVTAFAATNLMISQSLLSYYIKYVMPLFLIFAFFIIRGVWGFYLMPVSFLLIFFPVLTKRQQILLTIATIIVLVAEPGARSNILKFLFPFLLLVFYYLRKILSNNILEKIRFLLFITPIVLFILGVTGIFNVFKIQDYVKKDIMIMDLDPEGERHEVSLIDDTRTFLYEEVLQSAKHNNYWLFGRTPARGNDSMTFGLIEFEWTGRYERLTNEIGLANVFTWTGLVGVILYMAFFYQASYLAINRSNNIFAKMMGLYVAFRWLYSWIEDYQNFTINFLLLWMMIGLSLSQSFRNMNDAEVTFWVRGIFDTRYIRFQNFLIKKSLYEKSKSGSATDMSQQKG